MSITIVLISVMLMLGILISVAFFTLFERKILGYIQFRKGPNKLTLLGLTQPFSDAIKLISKEMLWPYFSNFNIYLIMPFVSLLISLVSWFVMPYMSNFVDFKLSGLFFMACLGASVFPMMIAGWASTSGYAYIGAIRAIAQSISYEVSLALIILSYFSLCFSLEFLHLSTMQIKTWFLIFTTPLAYMWIISIFAELNRPPFDFAEGESELVSGFNIEYSSLMFGSLFLAEYSTMILMSMLTIIFNFGDSWKSTGFIVKLMLMLLFILWVRGSFPRFRYDYLMILAWNIFLPLSISCFMFFYSFNCL